jgi:hypothetical protein
MKEPQRHKEIAARAERTRLAMRAGRQKARADGSLRTKRDVLDWLKFAKSEAEAAERDLVALAAMEGIGVADLINQMFSNDWPPVEKSGA